MITKSVANLLVYTDTISPKNIHFRVRDAMNKN